MEIKIGSKQMLKILYVISWIIFIGVSIEAGAFISNAFLTLLLNPAAAKHLWQEVDLSSLHQFDPGYFFAEMLLMSIVAVLKAVLFYLIIKILHQKKLNIAQPFSNEVGRFVFRVSYLALGIGLFCWSGAKYTEWFVKQGVKMPDIQSLRFDGADVWLFMGVTLYVIAQVFKRGIEIQSENELTV
jgi:ABC-type antimicrobial peptide transport system permease subunit